MYMDEIEKIIEKTKKILKEKYGEHKIVITGIHIEKIVGRNEYAVTVNFNAIKDTKEGKIVIEQKMVITNTIIKFTKENKYIV
ncbi:hypothetical protein AFV9_gp01 [Betalipothrixvirus uzonense]|uniref:Uncharacterized protein n=1 Tax=Betalipothrixvirus uzonense TaxID=512792 RepID=B2CRH8_9VIRU|nr:hypothetical protein AFV9_gp01 [Acidianus filamentous virus 9]ACB37235.1 hypothetical protein [Acidianus filamentous virus 9]